MRIAILGSSSARYEVGSGIIDPLKLEKFCRSLGSFLGRSPHTILVETDHPLTADWMVVSGMLETGQALKAKIKVYYRYHRYSKKPFAEEEAACNKKNLFNYVSIPEKFISPTHLRMLRDADVAIVVGGGANSYPAGLAAALMGVRLIPVATFGGAGGRLWEQFHEQFKERRVKLPTEKTWNRLTSNPRNALQAVKAEIAGLPWLMIVHGRSPDKRELINILKKMEIKKPFVLCEKFETGKTIPAMLEQEALQTDAAIALFTPDDEAASLLDDRGNSLNPSKLRKRAQARQNVCVEYGWFWGRLGLKRVLLIIKGKLELPSDLSGLVYVHYKQNLKECKKKIKKFVLKIRNR